MRKVRKVRKGDGGFIEVLLNHHRPLLPLNTTFSAISPGNATTPVCIENFENTTVPISRDNPIGMTSVPISRDNPIRNVTVPFSQEQTNNSIIRANVREIIWGRRQYPKTPPSPIPVPRHWKIHQAEDIPVPVSRDNLIRITTVPISRDNQSEMSPSPNSVIKSTKPVNQHQTGSGKRLHQVLECFP